MSKKEIINKQELLDELYSFKRGLEISEEENAYINNFIDNIADKIQKINERIDEKNIENFKKTIEIILKEDKDG